jgi:hypothetical protein
MLFQTFLSELNCTHQGSFGVGANCMFARPETLTTDTIHENKPE